METFKPKLVLNDFQQLTYSDLRKETIQEELDEIGQLEEGKIYIIPTFLYEDENEIEIGTFIVNGKEEKIEDIKLPIIIKDINNNKVFNKIFMLEDILGLDKEEAIPITFKVKASDLSINNFNKDEIKIEYTSNLAEFDSLFLDIENLPENFPQEKLLEIQSQLQVYSGVVKFSPVQLTKENGKVSLMLLINNGTKDIEDRDIIPITIEKNNGDILLSDWFSIDVKGLNPYKSRIIELSFDEAMFKGNIDEEANYKVSFTVKE